MQSIQNAAILRLKVICGDLNDACNCLLTKSWPPAVMISLRAAEDSIRRLYKFKVGKSPQRMEWRRILDELVKMNNLNKSIMGYIDYIRELGIKRVGTIAFW